MSPRTALPLGFLLNRTAQEIRERTAAVLEPYSIGPRHFGLMNHLSRRGPLSQKRIGELHRIDRTTMVALLDDLEALKLVRRDADAEDRRRYMVTLTRDGAELMATASGQVSKVERDFLATFSVDEARRFRELLEKLLHAVTTEEGPVFAKHLKKSEPALLSASLHEAGSVSRSARPKEPRP